MMIQVGNKTFENGFKIMKIPFVAAGVFKIPYLVISIVYEPAADINKLNWAEYTSSTFQGTSISLGFGTDDNVKRPVNTDIATFKTLLDVSGSFLSNSSNPKAKIAGYTLMALSSGFGSYVASETTGRIVNNEINISMADVTTVGATTPTPNAGGPGIGDIIYCLKDCKFLWFVKDATFSTTLLGAAGTFTPQAKTLKEKISNSSSVEEKALFKALASFDPFINDPKVSPDKRRYSEPIFAQCVDAGYPSTQTHIVTNADKYAAVRYTINTEDYVQGWGSYLGLPSVDETKTVQTTVTNSYSKTLNRTSTVSSSIHLNGPCKDYWIFYDKVFGTFAVTDFPPTYLEPTHSGIYRDTHGSPMPNKNMK